MTLETCHRGGVEGADVHAALHAQVPVADLRVPGPAVDLRAPVDGEQARDIGVMPRHGSSHLPRAHVQESNRLVHGAHQERVIVYGLNRQYEALTAQVALHETMGDTGSVKVEAVGRLPAVEIPRADRAVVPSAVDAVVPHAVCAETTYPARVISPCALGLSCVNVPQLDGAVLRTGEEEVIPAHGAEDLVRVAIERVRHMST
mmetsp:Transcript_15214/g.40849  ORF Transcript_15214/g.40849 Transcript_15214/m.40849 type:complete len:203 (-) Transcript_15214:176-784(-)